MASLEVNINGTIYTENYNGIEVEDKQNILNTTVYVDGSDLNNSFNITCDSDWVEIMRLRNQIKFTVKKNCKLDSRMAVIQFNHNLDRDKFIRINLVQRAAEYTISINSNSFIINDDDMPLVEFDDLLDENDEEKEVCIINVDATNGICDFDIAPVIKYAKNEKSTDYFKAKYDNAFALRKLDNRTLEITNYGKVSMYDDTYYVITLYHKNNPKCNTQFKIRYNPNINRNGFGLI